ncbi:hypothetical protein [Saccharospirillum salsuginis]|uniref:Uncharacterized protein n=1 Tax=Saccharospirillum salsuginis TaxID=418750 RepID=A0A918K4P1_9GAMM|nr:hypothetical protein [Saccharospirillum salsuginis]GGX47788.1 hypothetical protein GCM10007392_13320 [Saccharospirillum salsuginis]
MLTELVLPTVIWPLLIMGVAFALGRGSAWMPAVAAFVAGLGAYGWIQGAMQWPPTAMDGIWLMGLVASVAALLRPGRAVALLLLGLPVSVWAVWVFASSLTPMVWVAQILALLVPVGLAWLWLNRADPDDAGSLFWPTAFLIAPAAVLAPVIGLAGSLKLAELAGALGVVMAVSWLIGFGLPLVSGQRPHRTWRALVPVLTLPLVWVALVAYHLVEVSPWALLPAALPWVGSAVLVVARRPDTRWLEPVVLVAATALPLVFSLWYAWPEQSLY